jgi:imidazolonepropionase-like amidohydrolase
MRKSSFLTCIAASAALMPGCSDHRGGNGDGPNTDALYPSTYTALPSKTTLIAGGTVLTGDGQVIENGSVLWRDGVIAEVGSDISPPDDAIVIDGAGKWVTPGIIDSHSHLGVYPSPAVAPHSDGNEATDPNTARVWAEHSVWPQDPGFNTARAGGITAMQILPGSANLFGGRSVTVKNVPSRTMQGMKFPGAPHGLKMACGENPKRVYGVGRQQTPSTRMGNVAGYRAAWAQAISYRKKWEDYESGKSSVRPDRDLGMETLNGVLDGEILVHNHCYRADEMAVMMDIAREFGYRITSFHHAVESYKIADLLAADGICSSVWADWWGFKIEAFDAVRENAAILEKAGACVIIHSDSEQGIQRLNQEAAKAMAAGNRSGIGIDEAVAISWITLNPARALGIADKTGSLETGKMADIVIWDGNPFSVYSHAEQVYVDGALIFDRNDPEIQPKSDFTLGVLEVGGVIE